jgi:hypothetical protein
MPQSDAVRGICCGVDFHSDFTKARVSRAGRTGTDADRRRVRLHLTSPHATISAFAQPQRRRRRRWRDRDVINKPRAHLAPDSAASMHRKRHQVAAPQPVLTIRWFDFRPEVGTTRRTTAARRQHRRQSMKKYDTRRCKLDRPHDEAARRRFQLVASCDTLRVASADQAAAAAAGLSRSA